VAALFWSALSAACGDGVSSDSGLDAAMRVERGQFMRGEPPATTSSVAVESVLLLSSTIWPGYAGKLVSGALSHQATGVALNLANDRGYWLVSAGAPDVAAPDLPTFRVRTDFAESLSLPSVILELRAIDSDGRFGAVISQPLSVSAAPKAEALGELVITLEWDSEADLDLHVVDPLDNEIYHGDPSSRDGFSPSRGMSTSFGVLSFDSNAGCRLDGQRREDVTFAKAPPPGRYQVRVDTPSLCNAPIANFTVKSVLQGALLASVAGVSVESDTWGSHGRGAGLLVLEFDVP